MTLATLPTRRDEAFRYSDVDALATVWPVAAERVVIASGEAAERELINVANAEDVVVRNIEIVLEANAKYTLRVLNAGGRLGRISLDVTCHSGSDFHLGVVQLGNGKQTLEIISTVRHVQPDATSRQVVRTILSGGATGSYLGKVEVARGADGTDSVQDVKAMLLDRKSAANAVPQLEIHADDVKCAHGCAVGELDANALFYLQSRGVPPALARTLLLQAFVAGVFDGAPDEQRLKAAALARLEALA